MAKTTRKRRGLVATMSQTTAAVRKTPFDLFLRYSSEGWQVMLGNVLNDERWTKAPAPAPLTEALDGVLKQLVAQFAMNAKNAEQLQRRYLQKHRRALRRG